MCKIIIFFVINLGAGAIIGVTGGLAAPAIAAAAGRIYIILL